MLLTGKKIPSTILPLKHIITVKENYANTAPGEATVTETSTNSTLNFWKVWSATSFSNLGDGLYQIVFPLLAIRLTTSPSLVAGVSLMLSLPWLIFALQAGS